MEIIVRWQDITIQYQAQSFATLMTGTSN